MTEDKIENTSLIDQIKDTIKDSIKNEADKNISAIIESIKKKLAETGIEFTDQIQKIIEEAVSEIFKQTGESISTKVDGFLESKKDEWAVMALQDPDTARRKLRTFWAGISGICLIAGLAIGIFMF